MRPRQPVTDAELNRATLLEVGRIVAFALLLAVLLYLLRALNESADGGASDDAQTGLISNAWPSPSAV